MFELQITVSFDSSNSSAGLVAWRRIRARGERSHEAKEGKQRTPRIDKFGAETLDVGATSGLLFGLTINLK